MLAFVRTFTFLFSGSKNFGKQGYEQAAKTFDQSILDRRLDGRSIMVTGANQGIGLKTSEELAKRGCTLYMVCRNAQRGEEAVQAVRALSGNQDVHLKVCDVSNLKSVMILAADFQASGEPLHLLVNNAGVMVQQRTQSVDGYDMNFATNTLGGWALTKLLAPVLEKSSPSKVVFISSGGMLTEKLDTEDMQNLGMGDRYDGTVAYARDKRRQVALVEHFASEWKDTGVGAYSMHPGWTTTEGVKDSIPGFYNFFKNKFRDLHQGTDTIVWLALQTQEKLEPGAFYLDRAPQTKHLTFGGTVYTTGEVDRLVEKLEAMLLKAQQQPSGEVVL